MSKITIIVPAYRAENTLAAALDSVRAQTMDNWECIVVDDASPDDTGRAFQDAVGDDARFRYKRLPVNGGPSGARNRGAALARGEWLAFLDGDDAWLPWRLELQITQARARPDVGLWCGEAVRWDGVSGDLPKVPPSPAFHPVRLSDFVRNNPVATSSVLMRRDVFMTAGGFDPAFRGPEDLDLWLRVAQATSIGFIEAPLSLYRCVTGSLSLDERRFLPEVLRVLEKAFGPGGALASQIALRPAALSTQYWNASWMAFARGDRVAAVRHWWRAWRLNRRAEQPESRAWWPLLLRYMLGGITKSG